MVVVERLDLRSLDAEDDEVVVHEVKSFTSGNTFAGFTAHAESHWSRGSE